MKKKILLADEDESVRKMVARVLEGAGYAVTVAGSGAEAVSVFEAGQPPDLVVLDQRMPDQDGWAAFESISRLNSLVPVIGITAWSNQYEQAVQRGIDALMEKPLDPPLLLRRIKELLDEAPAVRLGRRQNRV